MGSVHTAYGSDDIAVPFRYAKGQLLFESNCAGCHAANLSGTDQGPPLVHPFYKPSHHSDASFLRAGLNGVRAHHWHFGDMPAIIGMTESKMKSIIPYIRFYQQAKKLY